MSARLLAVALLLVAVGGMCQGASMVRRRDVADGNSQRICHKSTPCEWAVYTPFTRRIEYVMKNTCECAAGQVCVRTGDDLSASAYVHRCRTPENPVTSPPV